MYKILWIGLSNKINTEPLDINTNTGKIIQMIESELPQYNFYKTNLVNFAPIDSNGKLRYPNNQEMSLGYIELEKYIKEIRPDLCIFLGNIVTNFLKNKINNYINIHHPSYIYVYKIKYIDEYIKEVKNKIENFNIKKENNLWIGI